jgi:hypothetical protein
MWADRISVAFRLRWHEPQVSNSVALVSRAGWGFPFWWMVWQVRQERSRLSCGLPFHCARWPFSWQLRQAADCSAAGSAFRILILSGSPLSE